MRQRKNSLFIRQPVVMLGIVLLVAGYSVAQDGPCAGKVADVLIDGPFPAQGLAVNNHRLVTTDSFFTLSSWELRDPAEPVLRGLWTKLDHRHDLNGVVALDLRGFAYSKHGVWPYDNFGIRIWDVRNSQQPRQIAVAPGEWIDFFADGHYMVGVDFGFKVVDVSDPFNPEVVCDGCGDLGFPSLPPSVSGLWARIARAGEYAVALEYNTVLVIDYSDPTDPIEVASLETTQLYYSEADIWASDDLVVLFDGDGGEVVDLSDPTLPVVSDLGLSLWSANWGILHGRTLLVGSLYYGIRRIDLSDPRVPVELSPIPLDAEARLGAVWNDHLYVYTSDGIRIIDLRETPIEVGRTTRAQFIDRIAVSGSTGIATGGDTLRVYDLDHLDGPREEGQLVFDGWPRLPDLDETVGVVSPRRSKFSSSRVCPDRHADPADA